MSMKEIAEIRELKRDIEAIIKRLDALETKKPDTKGYFQNKGK